jgi:hypothetical protein
VDRTNILAPGFVPAVAGITFFPPSPPKGGIGILPMKYMGWKPMPLFKDWPNWEVVSSYSSATAPESHGISCADPLFQARKELGREVAACPRRCKTYLEFIFSVRSQIFDREQ